MRQAKRAVARSLLGDAPESDSTLLLVGLPIAEAAKLAESFRSKELRENCGTRGAD
jgi:hypothetical protein